MWEAAAGAFADLFALERSITEQANRMSESSSEADLEYWSKLSDCELRKRLCDLPGVGTKVANCAMLFAYERISAFPIDVWIERVLREQYFAAKSKVTAKTLAEFAATYFGAHGGYAQQYLFHDARMNRRQMRGRSRGPSFRSG